MNKEDLLIIGSNAKVTICGRKDIPAKIDTGADSSSIWVSHLRVDKDGVLKFRLFDESSPFYNGKVISRKDYNVAVVRSATGEEQIRYRTNLTITILGQKIKTLFNLSNRSANNFPILIGRRDLAGKFLVDVSRNDIPYPPKNSKTPVLQQEMKKDPHKFFRKYVKPRKEQK